MPTDDFNALKPMQRARRKVLSKLRFLLLAGSPLLGACGSGAGNVPEDSPPKTVRLLTIGNSFSENATAMLGYLANAARNVLVHHSLSKGGLSLQDHWEKALQWERSPGSPEGLYNNGRSLRQELLAERWDFITIQQVSLYSHDVATYRPYAENLRDYIGTYAPAGTEILFHQTWAYRSDDKRFTDSTPPASGVPRNQQEMYDRLTDAYNTIATELGIRTIPVGDAFFRGDTDSVWGYQHPPLFDPATATYPILPDQEHSLHTGWQWLQYSNDKPILAMDGHHASIAGQYLAACVFYDFLFEDNVTTNKFVPSGIAPDYARFLRETAHAAVTARRTDNQKNDINEE